MAEPLDPRLVGQYLMQGQVPDALDYMLPGGNLGPSASGRALPSWGPLDYAGMAAGGVLGGAAGAVAAVPSAIGAGGRWGHRMLTGGTLAGGAGGAAFGLNVARDVGMQSQLPPMPPYSPQVPQEYATPAYDDGTMYGQPYPPRR